MEINYTVRDYKHDYDLCQIVFNKHFRIYNSLKEDMLTETCIKMYEARKKYKSNLSKINTFLGVVAMHSMRDFLKIHNQSDYSIQSLSTPIADDLTLEDTIGEEMSINDLGLDRILVEIVRNAKRKHPKKSNKYLQYINLLVHGANGTEISAELNVTRQFVSKLKKQLKLDILTLAKKYDIKEIIPYAE